MYRIIYEIAGQRHTFWSRHCGRGKHGELVATNVETGEQKIIGNATPHVATEAGSVPPRIQEALES